MHFFSDVISRMRQEYCNYKEIEQKTQKESQPPSKKAFLKCTDKRVPLVTGCFRSLKNILTAI
jgi:hypothetical protein